MRSRREESSLSRTFTICFRSLVRIAVVLNQPYSIEFGLPNQIENKKYVLSIVLPILRRKRKAFAHKRGKEYVCTYVLI